MNNVCETGVSAIMLAAQSDLIPKPTGDTPQDVTPF